MKYKELNKPFELVEINILEASDETLEEISKERQLSLSLDEMHKIQNHFKEKGRNPTDIELENIAQSWSEHCSYKSSMPVLRDSIFKVEAPQNISVFSEDAAVIDFDDEHAYVSKIESHNHPSALDPYGGAATGIGGILRDVTCMGAQPVALIDPLFFGPLDYSYDDLPEGTKHPNYLFKGVVDGISDYGNRVGIPTTTGMINFDESYVGNCLVNVGCVGIMKKDNLVHSRVGKEGDLFVLAGGKTGRDGIHGVTFASVELEKESEEKSIPAVQLGDPITKEPLIHACLGANRKGLLTGLKDLGGGGLSCAVGEMAHAAGFGAEIDLEKVPVKEEGMAPWEIWVSESQERMMLSVDPHNLDEVIEILDFWDVESAVVGEVVRGDRVKVRYNGEVIYDMDIDFINEGADCVRPHKEFESYEGEEENVPEPSNYNSVLLKVMSSYNIASKEFAIRQYDQTIRGNTVLSPLQGKLKTPGPGDASIIKPVKDSKKGLALSTDVNSKMTKIDPYWGAASGVEESFRNLISVGAKPHSMVDCLNFGNPEREEIMGQFKAACEGMYFTANEMNVPFVSGNVSFYNESHAGAIKPTPTVLGCGIIEDVEDAVTMDIKKPGNELYLIGKTNLELGGSEYFREVRKKEGKVVPRVHPEKFKEKGDAILEAMEEGLIESCHDCSEGGLAVALSEMLTAGGFGAEVSIENVLGNADRPDYKLFSESNGRWVVEIKPENAQDFLKIFEDIETTKFGETKKRKKLKIDGLIELELDEIYETWREPIYKEVGGE